MDSGIIPMVEIHSAAPGFGGSLRNFKVECTRKIPARNLNARTYPTPSSSIDRDSYPCCSQLKNFLKRPNSPNLPVKCPGTLHRKPHRAISSFRLAQRRMQQRVQ